MSSGCNSRELLMPLKSPCAYNLGTTMADLLVALANALSINTKGSIHPGKVVDSVSIL
jgi:hypothetical protein